MTELEKLKSGKEYCFTDPEIATFKTAAVQKCRRLNALDPADTAAMQQAVADLFGSIGKNVSVQPDFNCDFGMNIHAGDNFLTNYNVTILDVAPVNIGNDVMIGPNTLITSVGHPLSPKGRKARLGICKPVNIGNNVWIGGNCTILPGVTIGDNSVIAAGAVVTKDIPANCVAAGVPAKIIKTLESEDE